MLISIDQVLSKTEVRDFRAQLDAAAWEDGAATAGTLAKSVKRNQQITDGSELCQRLGQHILRRLSSTPLFISAALPRTIYPPKFNRYADGGTYGFHVDGAVMGLAGKDGQAPTQLRSDVSCTLFLAEPGEYDGGELIISDTYGEHEVKLPAGDMIVYPSSSLHRVTPVTRGARIASFFWVQSLVRDGERRRLLLELDTSIQSLTTSGADRESVLRLTNIYHNLLRRWAEV